MKIISMISMSRFEVQKNQDAMLIGNYFELSRWHSLVGWCGHHRVFIADDNRFEDL